MYQPDPIQGIAAPPPHVADDGLRDLISHCLNEFEQNVLPVFGSLRHQVIHGDLNPGNVLVAENDDEMIAGVIDFGDMVRAPLIIDAMSQVKFIAAIQNARGR